MNHSQRGFSLIELVIVVAIFGLMLAFAVPAVGRLGRTHNLQGARDDIASQIEMARARAIGSGVAVPIHFYVNTYGFDYHIHYPSTVVTTGWNLPKGVSYAFPVTSTMNVTMLNTGRASNALVIPLVNTLGQADTVTVLTSGMVVAK